MKNYIWNLKKIYSTRFLKACGIFEHFVFEWPQIHEGCFEYRCRQTDRQVSRQAGRQAVRQAGRHSGSPCILDIFVNPKLLFERLDQCFLYLSNPLEQNENISWIREDEHINYIESNVLGYVLYSPLLIEDVSIFSLYSIWCVLLNLEISVIWFNKWPYRRLWYSIFYIKVYSMVNVLNKKPWNPIKQNVFFKVQDCFYLKLCWFLAFVFLDIFYNLDSRRW